jgi:hypothetical protein
MPRYVILEHDHPMLHWDFLLEAGLVLRTWRLEEPPHPDHPVRAEASFDHRLLYLDYEGPISGGRGHVRRWDQGTFEWLADRQEEVAVRLTGERLHGLVRLERGGDGRWMVTVSAD